MKKKNMKIVMMIVLKLPACYENGWFEGDTEYHNNICKYHVSFNDVSEDYISEKKLKLLCSKNCKILTNSIFKVTFSKEMLP